MAKAKKKIPAIYQEAMEWLRAVNDYPYCKDGEYCKGNYRMVRYHAMYRYFNEYPYACNLVYYKDKLICKAIADPYDEEILAVNNTIEYVVHEDENNLPTNRSPIYPEKFLQAELATDLDRFALKVQKEIVKLAEKAVVY